MDKSSQESVKSFNDACEENTNENLNTNDEKTINNLTNFVNKNNLLENNELTIDICEENLNTTLKIEKDANGIENNAKTDQFAENASNTDIFKILDIPPPSRSSDNVSDLVYIGRKRKFRDYSNFDKKEFNEFSEGFTSKLAQINLLTKTEVRWNIAGKTYYCAVDCSKIDKQDMLKFISKLFEVYFTDKSVGCITFARNWAVFTACNKNKR